MENKPIGAEIHLTASCIDNFISTYLSRNTSLNLTAMEGMTLKFIARSNGAPLVAKQIMDFTNLSKATTSQTLNSLVDKGLIVMKEKEGDKRSKNIYLTEEGKKKISGFIDSFKEINQLLETNFSQDEKETLLILLKRLRGNIASFKGE